MRFITCRGVFTPGGRFVAALMAGLMLALVIGGASPEAHDHMCAHHRGDAGADHCIINAFANGEGYAAPAPVIVTPFYGVAEAVLTAETRFDCQPGEFDLPPTCGPPLSAATQS